MSRPSHLQTRYKYDLTPRQEEILRMMARGRTNAEIAEAYGMSLDGAKYHVREILAKLGVESREEAVAAWSAWRGSAVGRAVRWGGAIFASKLGAAAVGGVAVVVGAVGFGWTHFHDSAGGADPDYVMCDPRDLTLTSTPERMARGVGASLRLENAGQACHLFDEVVLTMANSDGSSVAAVPGPLSILVDRPIDRTIDVGQWTLDQYCFGSAGPLQLTATLGSVTAAPVQLDLPPCENASRPPDARFEPWPGVAVAQDDCRAPTMACGAAERVAAMVAAADRVGLRRMMRSERYGICATSGPPPQGFIVPASDGGLLSWFGPCGGLVTGLRGLESGSPQDALSASLERYQQELAGLVRSAAAGSAEAQALFEEIIHEGGELAFVRCTMGVSSVGNCAMFEVGFGRDGRESMVFQFQRERGQLPTISAVRYTPAGFSGAILPSSYAGSRWDGAGWVVDGEAPPPP